MIAIVPPLSGSLGEDVGPLQARRRLGVLARLVLVGMALGLTAVFAIAFRIWPYGPDGTPLTMETHRQLGLPPCTFYEKTGVPCPSCGMTTSFALLVHGDVWNSLRANAVGTVTAGFCLLLVPWCLVSALLGRALGVWAVDRALMRVLIVFLVALFVRWAIVLGLLWAHGGHGP